MHNVMSLGGDVFLCFAGGVRSHIFRGHTSHATLYPKIASLGGLEENTPDVDDTLRLDSTL